MKTQEALNVIIGADLDPKFNAILSQARNEFDGVNDEIKELHKNQKLISNFEFKTKSLEKSTEKVKEATKQVARLKAEKHSLQKQASIELEVKTGKLSLAETKLNDARQALERLQNTQGKTEQITKAEIKVKRLTNAYNQAQLQVTKHGTKYERATNKINASIKKSEQSLTGLEQKQKTVRDSHIKLAESMRKAGVSTKNITAQTEAFKQKQAALLAQAKLNNSAYGRTSRALKHQENQIKLTGDALRHYQLKMKGMNAEQRNDVIQREKAIASLKKHQQQIEQVKSSVKGLGFAFASVLTAGIGAATWKISESSLEIMRLAKEAQAMSSAIGVNREALQQWQYAGEKVGLTAENVADILKDVGDKIGDLYLTEGGGAKDVFDKLKLDIKELKTLAPDKVLLKIAEAMDKVELSQSEKTFLFESLGNDLTKLEPLLRNNAQGLKAAADEAKRFGVVLDDVRFDRLIEGQQHIDDLQNKIKGLNNEFSLLFAEVSQKIGLTSWFEDLKYIVGDTADKLHDQRAEIKLANGQTMTYGEGLIKAKRIEEQYTVANEEKRKSLRGSINDLIAVAIAHQELAAAELKTANNNVFDQEKKLSQKSGVLNFWSQDNVVENAVAIEKKANEKFENAQQHLKKLQTIKKQLDNTPLTKRKVTSGKEDKAAAEAKKQAVKSASKAYNELEAKQKQLQETYKQSQQALAYETIYLKEGKQAAETYKLTLQGFSSTKAQQIAQTNTQTEQLQKERQAFTDINQELAYYQTLLTQGQGAADILKQTQAGISETAAQKLAAYTQQLEKLQQQAAGNDSIIQLSQQVAEQQILLTQGKAAADAYTLSIQGLTPEQIKAQLALQKTSETLSRQIEITNAANEDIQQTAQQVAILQIELSQGAEAAQAFQLSSKGYTEEQIKAQQALQKTNETLSRQIEITNAANEDIQQTAQQLAILQIELSQGAEAAQAFQLGSKGYTEEQIKAKQALEKNIESLQRYGEITKTINEGLTEGIVDAVMTGKVEFSSLKDSVKSMFANMMLRPQIQAVISQVGGQLGLPQLGGQGGIDYGSIINKGLGYFAPQSSATTIAEQQVNAFSNPFATGTDGFVASNQLPAAQATNWGGVLTSGLTSYGLTQKYGAPAGIIGGASSMALSGGLSSLAAGGGFMSGAGAALMSNPYGWAALAAGTILGSVFKDDDSPRAHLTGKTGLEGNDGLYLSANAQQLYGRQFTSANPFGSLHAVADGTHDIGKEGDQKLLSMLALDEYIGKIIASASDPEKVAEINERWQDFDYSGVDSLDQMFKQRLVTMSEGLDPLLANLVDWEDSTENITRRIEEVQATANFAVPTFRRLNFGIGQTNTEIIATTTALADYAGGLNNLSKATDYYYLNFYSDTERSQQVYAKAVGEVLAINQILGKTGTDMMDSHAEYREVLEGINTKTQEGQLLFTQMQQVMASVDLIADSGFSVDTVFNKLPEEMQKTALDNEEKTANVLAKLEENNKKAQDSIEQLGDSIGQLSDKIDSSLNQLNQSAINFATASQDSASGINDAADNINFDEDFN